MTPDPHNVYLSWVVYAITGKLREADALMREHGDAIRAIAADLRARIPVPSRTLYRGVLLTDAEAAPGVLAADLGVQSTSFTEDRDCALWFACPGASVGGAVVEHHAGRRVCGYLLERTTEPSEILFHHAWRRVPIPRGTVDLLTCAIFAERVGAIPETGACQFEWAIRTQSEVILEAVREPLAIRSVTPDAAPLEAKYGPPSRVYAVVRDAQTHPEAP